MRYAIISDIHSNLQALHSALNCIEQENVDEIICLGDIVGYNANPIECIDIVKNHPKIKHIVQGNHDETVTRFDNIPFSEQKEWSRDASDGLEYSHRLLDDNDIQWLKSHPEKMVINDPKLPFLISHHSPFGVSLDWGYILNWDHANYALMELKNNKKYKSEKIKLAFFGHSHVPTVAYTIEGGKNIYLNMGNVVCEVPIKIKKNIYYIINSGAIGQPRNKGFTTYAIFDTDKMMVNVKPFEYDIKGAQEAIRKAKYRDPDAIVRLAKRLEPDIPKNKT